MKKIFGAIISLALCVALTGCVSANDSNKDLALTILDTNTDLNLDPARTQSLATTSVGLIHRRLTTWELKEGKIPKVVPDLATDTGTPSDGGKTWTYTLKSGLKMSDGTPITSQLIKYGLERSFSPALSGGLSYHKSLLENAKDYTGPYEGKHLDSIQTPDDKTIVFHLNVAYGDWPWIVSTPAFAPVNPEKDTVSDYNHAPVASGPYKVDLYRSGSIIRLVRNQMWDKKTDQVRTAQPKSITFKLGNDSTVVAQRLIANAGKDYYSFGASKVPGSQLRLAYSNPTVRDRLAISDPGPMLYLAINNEHIQDVHLRRAINYAIDTKAVVLAGGGALTGKPANSFITPGIAGHSDYNPYPKADEGSLSKAKEELAKSAQKMPDTLVLLAKNSPEDTARAEAIAQSLEKLGVEIRIDAVESDSYVERATQSDGSSYDLAIASWNPDYPSPNSNLTPLFSSSEIGKGGYNISRYNNPKVDQALERATAQTDPEVATELWVEADKMILEDLPGVPLIYQRNVYLRGGGVKNFIVTPFPAFANYLVLQVSAEHGASEGDK